METTIKALYLGAKVTAFENDRYLKVFLTGTEVDDDPNIYGLDLMICSSDIENLSDFQNLNPLKPYVFRTKVMSGSKQRIAIKILGIKESVTERSAKQAQ